MTTEQPTIVMPVMSSEQTASWHGLMDLHVRVPTGWTLVGGQLVHLHCAERSEHPERPTDDIDAVVDVRTASDMLQTFTRALLDLGFAPDTSVTACSTGGGGTRPRSTCSSLTASERGRRRVEGPEGR